MVNHSCIDCGISYVYASPIDLQKHFRRGCPQAEEPFRKKIRLYDYDDSPHDESSDDESDYGWSTLLKKLMLRIMINISKELTLT